MLPGLGPDLVQRLPEAQGTVTGGELGCKREPVLVAQPEQELAPALGALAVAVLDREQLFSAARVGTDQHQQALPVVIEPGREVDGIGPEIDKAAGGEVALPPAFVLFLPALGQPPHRRRREPGGVRAKQRRQGLAELARRDALEVQPGKELLDVPGPTQIGRQDRGGEPDRRTVSGSASVT